MLSEEPPGTQDRESIPICAVFSLEEVVSADRRAAMVSRVISEFSDLPTGAKNALRSAVNDEITPTSGGFRKGQAGRALDRSGFLVQDPLTKAVLFSDDLAGAVLQCWAESHPQLQEAVERHLTGRGLSTPRPDLAEKRFRGQWVKEQWEAELDAFTRTYDDDFDRADVSLMLCYVTGNLPVPANKTLEPEESSSLNDALSAALSGLRELPPTAPEWERQIPDFVSTISRLIEEKAAQLRWAEEFDELVRTMREEYGELLSFFEHDPDEWSSGKVSPDSDTGGALRLLTRLRDQLAEYLPLHERAASISEERERTVARGTLQPAIIDTLAGMASLMSTGSAGPQDETPVASTSSGTNATSLAPVADLKAPNPSAMADAVKPSPLPPNPDQSPASSVAPASPQASVATLETPGPSSAEVEALRSENSELRDGSDALRSENQGLKDEVEALKSELFSSQASEDSWRLAYRSVMDGSMEEVGVAPPVVESVQDAVEMAKSQFRQELVFAPNADSSIEDNPFNDPVRVWEALKWLASTYYPSRMGRLRITDFDQSIKEACGWWYKGDQGETTVSRYKDSYTTRVDGKRYTLVEHIGKGTTFDARYTIRIAFDWDKDRRQVVVGYIGRHQQTDAS